jgi:hypothetical protein
MVKLEQSFGVLEDQRAGAEDKGCPPLALAPQIAIARSQHE